MNVISFEQCTFEGLPPEPFDSWDAYLQYSIHHGVFAGIVIRAKYQPKDLSCLNWEDKL